MTVVALANLCQTIAARIPFWTQGAGGNVSFKEVPSSASSRMWIKATGQRLGDVTTDAGHARLCVDDLREGLGAIGERLRSVPPTREEDDAAERAYADLLGSCAECGVGLGRPSMETGFHALLPQTFVAHFHSVVCLLMAEKAHEDPERWNSWRQQISGWRIGVLPAVRPGLLLTLAVQELVDCDAIILANHGVILQAEEAQVHDLLPRWLQVEASFCRDFGYRFPQITLLQTDLAADSLETLDENGTPLRIYFPDSAVFSRRLLEILEPAITAHPGHLRLAGDGMGRDRDVAEIWRATQVLYRLRPTLRELPAEIVAVVGTLPTELLRTQIPLSKVVMNRG